MVESYGYERDWLLLPAEASLGSNLSLYGSEPSFELWLLHGYDRTKTCLIADVQHDVSRAMLAPPLGSSQGFRGELWQRCNVLRKLLCRTFYEQRIAARLERALRSFHKSFQWVPSGISACLDSGPYTASIEGAI
jgi:hypothetical protein